jgi:PAS domain S-box-containing protein
MALSVSRAVSSTADPAFASDRDSTIVAWNFAAEALLGYTVDEAVGRPCHEVLRGRDVFGNLYCGARCPVYEAAMRGEPVTRFEVTYRAAKGERVRTEVSLLAFRGELAEEIYLIHLLRPVLASNGVAVGGRASKGNVGERRPSVSLTPRQTEVLRLLEAGCGTKEIAERLFISEVTVRNHVESLLRKLEVHSRLEAVITARMNGIL